ncbi:MAG: hypothetical protein EP330_11785 [Deltaproteobacteria bacterium]|nr:MAG: hypothetical protein EP330_11785 [Deltaproteobacteria bacterium]
MRLLAVLLLVGCGSAPEATGPTLPESWLEAVIREPARFEQLLVQTPREGWVALHAHDATTAYDAFDGPNPAVRRARARAAWELGRVHEVLGSLHVEVERAYHTESAKRPGGADAEAPAHLAAANACEDLAGADALGERLSAHRAARESADPTALLEQASRPVQRSSEPAAHTWFDPCLHTSLAHVWDQRALVDLDATRWSEASAWADGELESTLFAAWLDRTDLRRTLDAERSPGSFAAMSPATRALGLPDRVPGDPDAARAEVRALDEALDTWRERLAIEAPAEGATLQGELGLFARFRQEWLLARATWALEEGEALEALALLEAARDVTARDVGPANSPRLFALLAAARFGAGREREALDALHPLSEPFPEILGLRERLGDLTVLRGLTRTGDSKEN